MDISAMFTNAINWITSNLLLVLGACVAAWFFLFKRKKRRRSRGRSRRSAGRGRGRSFGFKRIRRF